MPIYQLLGNKGNYLFDPDNSKTVLKKHGKFCHTYLGINREDKTKVVIKKLNETLVDSPSTVERFMQEYVLDIKHPDLIRADDYVQADKDHYLIRPYIEGLDLSSILKDQKLRKKTPTEFFIQCIVKILTILEELHKKHIYHCDIRPTNLIVAFNEKKELNFSAPDVKLIDLGSAIKYEKTFFTSAERIPFALIYSPPEQILNRIDLINPATDIYYTGISLYEMLTGDVPFKSNHPEKMMNLQINQHIEHPENITESVFSVIQKATFKKSFPVPPNRLSPEEIKQILTEGQAGRYQNVNEFKNALLIALDNDKKRKQNKFFNLFR